MFASATDTTHTRHEILSGIDRLKDSGAVASESTHGKLIGRGVDHIPRQESPRMPFPSVPADSSRSPKNTFRFYRRRCGVDMY